MRKRKNIRLENFDYRNNSSVYFITICCANNQPYLSDDKIAETIIDQLKFRQKTKEISLYSFCLMPNHLHILISLSEEYKKDLSKWIASFKSFSSKFIKENFGIKSFWQANFYEHIVRKEESLVEIANYIIENPVRKNIVGQWSDYPYSWLIDDLPV